MLDFKTFFLESTQLEARYLNAINLNQMVEAAKIVQEYASTMGYKVKAHHGTSRADRVGNRFAKSRATSGPMSYFTDTRDIAVNYSKDKQDTSLETPSDYSEWFKVKVNGRLIPLANAWYMFDQSKRNDITKKLYTTGYTDLDAYEGNIINTSKSIKPDDSVTRDLRDARGNALIAAKSIWLDSAQLYGEEETFLDVLKALGVDAIYVDPYKKESKVYDVYLKIEHLFTTHNITSEQLNALQRAANLTRSVTLSDGADPWDKRTQNPQEWIKRLIGDIKEKKNSHVWTSIPDWVTKAIRKMGYDGICDTGGKIDGDPHMVWIPFEPYQIKSAEPITYDSSGKMIPLSKRFNILSKDIRF